MASIASSSCTEDLRGSLPHQDTTVSPSIFQHDQSLIGGSRVELWRVNAGHEVTAEDVGIIARLARSCLDSLSCLAKLPQARAFSKNDRSLQRCLATFKLWSSGHRIWDGKLDRVLERSKSLQSTTISVLNPLCKILSLGTLVDPVSGSLGH
jgi:hypothetical protein